MFLTANRIDPFDPAFESRIHLTIDYPKLETASGLHIRNTFARSAELVEPSSSTVLRKNCKDMPRWS